MKGWEPSGRGAPFPRPPRSAGPDPEDAAERGPGASRFLSNPLGGLRGPGRPLHVCLGPGVLAALTPHPFSSRPGVSLLPGPGAPFRLCSPIRGKQVGAEPDLGWRVERSRHSGRQCLASPSHPALTSQSLQPRVPETRFEGGVGVSVKVGSHPDVPPAVRGRSREPYLRPGRASLSADNRLLGQHRSSVEERPQRLDRCPRRPPSAGLRSRRSGSAPHRFFC